MSNDARELSRSLLEEELPRRWRHSQGVAGQARAIRRALGDGADVVEAAAWLHDIGYATPLAITGFHPLDGARYLRDTGFGDRLLWTLVAHHSCAIVEAEWRGLGVELTAEFPLADADRFAVSALTYCDMTTGPDGRRLEFDERLAEILARYPEGHVVHEAISHAASGLRAQVDEVTAVLEKS